MTEASQLLLQHFKEKKAEKDSVSVQEARRLVNLYRSLSCFGNDFLPQYNQMLLAVKPNVKRLLSTFMGGKEVEDYLEFLEQNAHLTNTEVEQTDVVNLSQMKGYLPLPDDDLKGGREDDSMMLVSKVEWQEMKSQKEALLNTLNELCQNSAPNSQSNSSNENYSEIVEDTSGGK